MLYELRYHPDVKETDIPLMDLRTRTRIMTVPHQYGEPLRKTLKGYWKLRVGDYRVVFKVVKSEVLILGIIHRKNVYGKIKKRTD